MTPATMRAVRLHGPRDLRLDTLPVTEPGAGELLVRIEACGICPTDVRKFHAGTADDAYPLNPGHEWVGRVEAVGESVPAWQPGARVYGDTYAGYAEYALLPVESGEWSYGALEVPESLPTERAVFVEPLADCLHAVHDQGRVRAGDHVVVHGAGQMGLQIVLVAAGAGARVLAVDPLPRPPRAARSTSARRTRPRLPARASGRTSCSSPSAIPRSCPRLWLRWSRAGAWCSSPGSGRAVRPSSTSTGFTTKRSSSSAASGSARLPISAASATRKRSSCSSPAPPRSSSW